MKKKYLFFYFFILSFSSYASHLAGGDISYKYIGPGKRYQVKLNLYRDCSGASASSAGFVDITFRVISTCGATLTSAGNGFDFVLENPGGTEISQLCPSQLSNSTCNGGSLPGMQRYTYVTTITIPNTCPNGNWIFSYYENARNPSINVTTSNYESFHITSILDPSFTNNSSPYFTAQPIPYVCANSLVNYNFGVVENDNDSLRYTLVNVTSAIGSLLAYNPGYSPTSPIPGIVIDPNTGQIAFIAPAITGNYIVVVRVQEYDKATGAYKGYVQRDVQFVVYNCNNTPPSAFSGNVTSLTVNSGSAVRDPSSQRKIDACEGSSFRWKTVFTDVNPGNVLTMTTNAKSVFPNITYSMSGTNPLTVTWNLSLPLGSAGPSGITESFSVSVNDRACPTPGLQLFTYSLEILNPTDAGPDLTICGTQKAKPIVTGDGIFTWYNLSNVMVPVSASSFTCNPCANPQIKPSSPGTYTFVVKSNLSTVGCTRDTLRVIVKDMVIPTFVSTPSICLGDLNLPSLVTTSTNNITGAWFPTTLNSSVTTTYYFFPNLSQQCTALGTMTVPVKPPSIVPQFNPLPAICLGDIFVPTLVNTSTNGIVGSWFPPTVNSSLTTTYSFTPNPGQCAKTAKMVVPVNTPSTIPTFKPIPDACFGGVIADLPIVSSNLVSGTWSPPVNNLLTTVYTFTPDPGQCVQTGASLTLTVVPTVVSSFDPLPAICSGDVISDLPLASTNLISGTWSPSLTNTTTTIYTFTPDAGQCGTSATLTLTVNPPSIVSSFSPVGGICTGAFLADLPLVSTNLITGSWSPALDNTTTTVYTFTPDPGQCATLATLTIMVNSSTLPDFTPIDPICEGEVLAALPLVSTNLITGTWSPALDNTTTSLYTFTPDPGQCATLATLTITVNPNLLPDFTPVDPICEGDVLADLPIVSTNLITGTWSPAMNNTQSSIYTFTPDALQCATLATLSVMVTPKLLPEFSSVAPICEGDVLADLPTASTNGFTGSWSPVMDNTQSTVYTFNPDPFQCATVSTLSITVNPKLLPEFSAVAAICEGATLSALPLVSTNLITGSWSPAINNTQSTVYSFTPSADQCATLATLTITVNPNLLPEFPPVDPICEGEVLAALPIVSTNLISGTWTPVPDNTQSTTYSFTPTAGQCANSTTLAIEVLSFPQLELGEDLYVNTGEEVQLSAVTDSLVAWFPEGMLDCTTCTDVHFIADSTLLFYAISSNRIGCKTVDSVTVFVSNDTYFYIPNSFSPNGDNTNEVFNVVSYKAISYSMQVYNRWGNLIYEWTDKEAGWDGNYKGEACIQDSYVYTLKAKDNQNKPIKLEGTVTLLR